MRRLLAIALPLLAAAVVLIAIANAVRSPNDRRSGVLPTLERPDFTLTASAPAPVAAAVPTRQFVHTVVAGDTLLGIAILYDIDMNEIAEANVISDTDTLDIGQELIIPGFELPTPIPLETLQAAVGPGGDAPQKPPFVAVNNVAEGDIVVFSDAARQTARETFAHGQTLGRNPRAYTTAGDSTTELPFFLGRFDEGPYNLGEFAYLQPVIDFFQGSFNHDSVSVRVGLHAWTLFDPTWSDKARCLPSEAPLPCEIRLQNPSILFIRLGSNDYGVPELFDENIRLAVEYALEQGVIPVIGTKADRGEGSDSNNEILRAIAADYNLLLWDFDRVAGTMPNRGLDQDAVHMTAFFAHDYTQPEAFQRGHAVHNLTALMVLDTLWKEVILAHG